MLQHLSNLLNSHSAALVEGWLPSWLVKDDRRVQVGRRTLSPRPHWLMLIAIMLVLVYIQENMMLLRAELPAREVKAKTDSVRTSLKMLHASVIIQLCVNFLKRRWCGGRRSGGAVHLYHNCNYLISYCSSLKLNCLRHMLLKVLPDSSFPFPSPFHWL